MGVNISEIINNGGYKSSDSELIITTLRESEKYKKRVKSTLLGTVVEGDLIEIINDLDTFLNKNSGNAGTPESKEQERLAAIERFNTQKRLAEADERRKQLAEAEKRKQLAEANEKRKADCVYDLIGVRGRSMKVFDDHVEIKVELTAGAVLTGNLTDGIKIIFYKDVIGIQFKESTGIIGYLQFETASGLMNNNSSNFWNENTFTYEATKPNTSNEEMKEVFSYVVNQISKYKQIQSNCDTSSADEIRKYKELLDIGAITQDEYEVKKKQLLNE